MFASKHSSLRSLTDASHNKTALPDCHDSQVIVGRDDTGPFLNLRHVLESISSLPERLILCVLSAVPIVFIILSAPWKGARGKMAQAVPNNRLSHRGPPSP